MTALAKDRDTPRIAAPADELTEPVAASEIIYRGAMASYNTSGDVVAAGIAAAKRFAGVAKKHADNSAGSAGDISALVSTTGIYEFAGSGFDADTDLGKPVFALDDQTVSLDPSDGEFVGNVAYVKSATEIGVRIRPATNSGGTILAVPFAYMGTVGTAGVKAFEDLELPRDAIVRDVFVDAEVAPGAGYQCDCVLSDGTTANDVTTVIDDTATHGELKGDGQYFAQGTDLDMTLTDDNASGSTADVKGVIFFELIG